MGYERQIKASDSVSYYDSVLRSDIDKFQSTQRVNSRLPRRTYLVLFRRADLTKFPTRKGLGKYIKKHFNSGSGKVKVQHRVCAKEKHQIGGLHYHVSDNHDSYYSPYRYICKDDDLVHHNKNHPNLDDVASPRMKKSTQAY